MPRESLTLLDLSDREFLLILDEAGTDDDGWVDSMEVARRLDMESRRSASVRLSWLARVPGLCERENKRDAHGNIRVNRKGVPVMTQRWRLTPLGRRYAYGRLKTPQRNQLDRLESGQMLEVTRWVTERVRTDPTAKWLAGREWRYGMHQT